MGDTKKMKNMETINLVYNKLCDEESKEIFEARLKYIIDGNIDDFSSYFFSKNKKIYCPELDEYEKKNKSKEYIIFGGGNEGKKAYRILKACNKKVITWSDNDRHLWGEIIENLPVIMPGKLISDYQDKTIIITPRSFMFEIYQQLLMMGFPRERIFIPQNGFLLAFCGQQYFDLFSASEKEIFVDAGCWDGDTSKKFVTWCGNNYEKIYAFEPDENCWQNCEMTFQRENIEKIEFIKKATWNKTDILSFQGIGIGSSRVGKFRNSYQIPTVSIDEILNNERVTFIKMDVEGSELKTLQGAEKCIKSYKPKLAVCVYHKAEDLWVLANYIIKLNAEYKLYLRHYTSCEYETVLYAI